MVQTALGLNDSKPVLARSDDGGITWKEQGLIWPHLQEKFSIFGSVSASEKGELFFYGMRTPTPGPVSPLVRGDSGSQGERSGLCDLGRWRAERSRTCRSPCRSPARGGARRDVRHTRRNLAVLLLSVQYL